MCMVLLQQFGYLRFPPCFIFGSIFVSYPFLLLYDFGSAILRACGNSRYPFLALTLSGIVNVFLNIIFVVFFKLGVSGVAAATVLSTMLSALLLICRLKKDTSSFPFALHKCDLYSGSVSAILKVESLRPSRVLYSALPYLCTGLCEQLWLFCNCRQYHCHEL